MKSYQLSWLNKSITTNTTAILVPFYNEAGDKSHFARRLAYFESLATQHPELDIILIDDGSSDDPFDMPLNQFNTLSLASVYPNGQKIGALHTVIQSLEHDFIIFTDFDTELTGLEQLNQTYTQLNSDPQCMGCYFSMRPIANKRIAVQFQVVEYALERAAYHFSKDEGSVPIMPGAGCLYKRKIVDDLLSQHSGLRSGEDRETCLLGLELGYTVFYAKEIIAWTMPPQSFADLYTQRLRWSRGFVEVAMHKAEFYKSQMKAKTILGKRHRLDMISVSIFLLMPLIIFALFNFDTQAAWSVVGLWSLAGLIETYVVYRVAKDEFREIKHHKLKLMLMPWARVILEVPTWWRVVTSVLFERFKSAKA